MTRSTIFRPRARFRRSSYATGLRVAASVGVTLGGIEVGTRQTLAASDCEGERRGKMALPSMACQALEQYLLVRTLPASPALWDRRAPILANLEDGTPIATPRLRAVLQRFLAFAAKNIERDHPPPVSEMPRQFGKAIRASSAKYLAPVVSTSSLKS